jgi:predicted metal-dependent phosphoesterase TrpH
MKTDLHIHTTASDGRLSPAEVVIRAAKLGMKTIAITDHDSVEGIDAALEESRKFSGLLVIPGVELGADVPQGETHILGYFVDHNSTEFHHRLEMLRSSRVMRGSKMVEKLADLGIQLDWERILSLAEGASIGRPHIAQAMLEQGYISDFHEAFEKYIGHGKPAYIEREKLSPIKSVELIVKAGGLPVLAHPAGIEGLELLILRLKQAGLVGMEVNYKDYPKETMAWLGNLANKHGLIPCGGSDYHGFDEAGNEIGRVDVPQESVDRLIALAKQYKSSYTEHIPDM